MLVHCKSEPQRRANVVGHVGWHRRAENKGPRVVDEMLLQNGAPTSECARAGERLPARVHRGGKILHIPMLRRNSPAGRTMHSGGMRLVPNNPGAVTIRHRA